MGNCIYLPEPNMMDCYMCTRKIKNKYMYCVYCKKRFHYQCLLQQCPSLDKCQYCNTCNFRFIVTPTKKESSHQK